MNQGKLRNTTGPEANDLPAIDWNLCIKLANHKTAVAQEILLFVIQQLPADLQAIKDAQAQADYGELLRLVHKLHGALCYSGMPRLEETVALFESALKQDKVDKIRLVELSRRLEAEAQMVLASPLPG